MSVGSVLAFWCREGYQLVGSDKIYCTVRNGKPQWSNYLPVCEGEHISAGLFGNNYSSSIFLSELFSLQLFSPAFMKYDVLRCDGWTSSHFSRVVKLARKAS